MRSVDVGRAVTAKVSAAAVASAVHDRKSTKHQLEPQMETS
jgi:hypothetical protein